MLLPRASSLSPRCKLSARRCWRHYPVMYSRYETEKKRGREYQNAHKLPALATAVRNIWWMRVYMRARLVANSARIPQTTDKFTYESRIARHEILSVSLSSIDRLSFFHVPLAKYRYRFKARHFWKLKVNYIKIHVLIYARRKIYMFRFHESCPLYERQLCKPV